MKLSRTTLLTTALTLITAVTIATLLVIHGIFSVTSVTDFCIRLFEVREYLIELSLFVFIIGVIMSTHKRWLHIIGYFIFAAYWIIQWIQLGALITSNAFVSSLAFENVYYIRLIINPLTIILTISCLVTLGILIYISEQHAYTPDLNQTVRRCGIILVTTAVIITTMSIAIPERTQIKVDHYQEDTGLETTPPVILFIKTWFQHLFPRLGTYHLSMQEQQQIIAAGLPYFPNQAYPVMHTQTNNSSLVTTGLRRPNIILFFVEGFSAQTIGTYNPAFTDLTPNLDALAQQSLVIDHYYNHTAATYRGILGQLCSWYPYQEKSQAHYQCLNNILESHGYKTLFGTSEEKESTRIDETTQSLGFNQVFTAQDFSDQYLNKQPLGRGNALSDTQFGQALANLAQKPPTTQPFFLALYNLGTHAFIDTAPQEKKYKDGSNSSLNTIHNFDRAFGIFWDSFKKSPLAENTIIIVTADHAHYPEKPYTSIVKDPYYQSLFIDQIPFIIYDPSRKAARYDAHDATSINLAPTLLDYVKLSITETPFIGRSLFTRPHLSLNIAAYEDNYYLIQNQHIYSVRNRGPFSQLFPSIVTYMQSLYHTELTDTIWYHNQ